MPDLFAWASPMAGGILSWFAESTAVAGLLAALALLASKARRPRLGPATRHVLWLMVLVKLMAPPLVHWPWSVGSLARSSIVEGRPGTTVARVPEADPILPDRSRAATLIVTFEPDRAPAVDESTLFSWPSSFQGVVTVLVSAWLVGSLVLVFRQGRQVVRFRRLLVEAAPAPGWLVDEAERVGRRMAVGVPEIRVVPGIETPLIWCLGRPVLLIPVDLLKSLESARWRAILAHELAHLKRRDHWVRRLELAAGLAWWWNPLYWLTLRKLDHEAELACDAWALWASPGDRITYAESLIRICSALTTTEIAVPSLGIASTGPSFERRLTMILKEQVDCRASLSSVMAALMMAALSLPSWTLADEAGAKPDPVAVPAPSAAIEPAAIPTAGPAASDDDDDDDDLESAKKEKAKKDAERVVMEKKMKDLGHEMEKKLGPGSDFNKKMEKMGQDMEKKFGPGSDFARKMENFGVEIAGKFGPDSEFQKEIVLNFGTDSDLAKDLIKALGPDSEFAKEMKKLGLTINITAEVKDGADGAQKAKKMAEDKAKAEGKVSADAARKAKVMAEDQARKVRDEARKVRDKAIASRAVVRPDVEARKRESRIESLQARIEAMQKELNQLKAESKQKDEDKDDDEQG